MEPDTGQQPAPAAGSKRCRRAEPGDEGLKTHTEHAVLQASVVSRTEPDLSWHRQGTACTQCAAVFLLTCRQLTSCPSGRPLLLCTRAELHEMGVARHCNEQQRLTGHGTKKLRHTLSLQQ